MTRREKTLPGLDVSRETLDRLEELAALIEKWTRRINLIAPSTRAAIWERHIADCAQLWPLAPPAAQTWIDLGSGAGLPGLVIATVAAEAAPALRVTLVESDTRKSAFLRHAAARLGLAVEIRAERIEAVPPKPHDVVSARALAPLQRLLPLVHRFGGATTLYLLPKGAAVDSELTAARAGWHIEAERVTSLTDPDAAILKISELEPLT